MHWKFHWNYLDKLNYTQAVLTHSELVKWSFDCRHRSHWPPSWSGSRARWHWPGWQTVGADARCSAAGRVPQSEPGRAEAPAAWPTAGGSVTENPNVLIQVKVILMKRGMKLRIDRGHFILFLLFYSDDEPILYVLKIKINYLFD